MSRGERNIAATSGEQENVQRDSQSCKVCSVHRAGAYREVNPDRVMQDLIPLCITRLTMILFIFKKEVLL